MGRRGSGEGWVTRCAAHGTQSVESRTHASAPASPTQVLALGAALRTSLSSACAALSASLAVAVSARASSSAASSSDTSRPTASTSRCERGRRGAGVTRSSADPSPGHPRPHCNALRCTSDTFPSHANSLVGTYIGALTPTPRPVSPRGPRRRRPRAAACPPACDQTWGDPDRRPRRHPTRRSAPPPASPRGGSGGPGLGGSGGVRVSALAPPVT